MADLWWLQAWWRLGFEEKLGFLFWGWKEMMTWHTLIGSHACARINVTWNVNWTDLKVGDCHMHDLGTF